MVLSNRRVMQAMFAHQCTIVMARGRRGGYFPFWFHRNSFGGSDCGNNDDDVGDCNQAWSFGWLNALLTMLILVGVLACCFMCRNSVQKQHREPTSRDNDNYDQFVEMRDHPASGKSSQYPTNENIPAHLS